jgi:hypothetical protein
VGSADSCLCVIFERSFHWVVGSLVSRGRVLRDWYITLKNKIQL